MLGKFPAIISSNIFSGPFSLSSSRTAIMWMWVYLMSQQVGLAQAPLKSLLFPLCPSTSNTLCVPLKHVTYLFLNFLEFLWSSPIGLKSQMLWGLIPLMPDLQTQEPDTGLRTLIPVGEPLQYDYCLVYASPTQQEWGLVVLRIHPLYHLLMASSVSLEVEYLFW